MASILNKSQNKNDILSSNMLTTRHVYELDDDDDCDDEDASDISKVVISKEEYFEHLTKIQAFTKDISERKFNEVQLEPLVESSDEDLPIADLNPKAFAKKQPKKEAESLHEQFDAEKVNANNDDMFGVLDLEDEIVDYQKYQANTSDDIIEIGETSATAKRTFNRKIKDKDYLIEARLDSTT